MKKIIGNFFYFCSILGFASFAVAGGPGPEAQVDVSSLTQCPIYPKRDPRLAGYISVLQNTKGCQAIGNAAANYQTALGGVNSAQQSMSAAPGGGASPGAMGMMGNSPRQMEGQQLVTSLTALTTAFSQYAQQSAAGQDCPETNLVNSVRQQIVSSASGMATAFAGTSMFAPLAGSLAGALAQMLFSAIDGKNLAQTNLQQIIDQNNAKDMSCLYMNFFKYDLVDCDGLGGFMGYGSACVGATTLSTDIKKLQNNVEELLGIFEQAKSSGQANLPGDSGNTSAVKEMADELKQKMTLPDGKTQTTIHDALLDAAKYLAPKSTSLANGIRSIVSDTEKLSAQLAADENGSDEKRKVLETNELNDLYAAVDAVNRNAESVLSKSPELDPQLINSLITTSAAGGVQSPAMAKKGLALSLMIYFREIEPKEYSTIKAMNDLYFLNQESIIQAMNEGGVKFAAWIENRRQYAPTRLELFNAIQANAQAPIIRQMEKLKNDSQAGDGRSGDYTCENAIELGKSCAALAGAYFFKKGDTQGANKGGFFHGGDHSGGAVIGANQIDSSHVQDYYKNCGDLIDQKMLSDPLAPDTLTSLYPAPPGFPEVPQPTCTIASGSHYTFLKNLNDQDQERCAKKLQQTQCGLDSQMKLIENKILKSGKFGCTPGPGLGNY